MGSPSSSDPLPATRPPRSSEDRGTRSVRPHRDTTKTTGSHLEREDDGRADLAFSSSRTIDLTGAQAAALPASQTGVRDRMAAPLRWSKYSPSSLLMRFGSRSTRPLTRSSARSASADGLRVPSPRQVPRSRPHSPGPVRLLVISLWSSKSQRSCKVPRLTLRNPRLCVCRRDAASLALTLYYAQLVGNMLWTPLFFTLKQVSLTRDG